jgi:hemin uptake protein HemP
MSAAPKNLWDLIERAKAWDKAPPRRIPSHELLSGAERLLIEHGTRVYELRVTRQHKLILTK